MSKTLKKAVKRAVKSTQQIKAEISQNEKVTHIKEVVAKVFPLLEVDTVYDAQTVVNALSGFISAHVEAELYKIKLSDVNIDLSKEEDSKIKTAMVGLIDLLKDEPAKDLAQTLERLGKVFAEFGAAKFLKEPMTAIKIEDILK